jgi:anaerobic glycerol-3-phosphate dehydrogenase
VSSIDIKPKTAIIRGRPKKQTNEPISIPIQQQSPQHTYATIERDISLDRASFATVAVNSTTTQIASSMDTGNNTPKQSTFKRIQSLFRPSPSMFLKHK